MDEYEMYCKNGNRDACLAYATIANSFDKQKAMKLASEFCDKGDAQNCGLLACINIKNNNISEA